MTPAVRWLIVGLVAAGVVAPAVIPRLVPAEASSISAATLADRIRAANNQGWSGEVRTRGTLAVPSGDSFGSLPSLFGSNLDLRVWWADAQHWRVDRTRASGESDLIRQGITTVRWTYESKRARTTRTSAVRLPDESDLLPSRLARRMLDHATDSELSRLPSRRVDGRSAPGLRITSDDGRSTLSTVDVWADADTGFPLRVEIRATGNPTPILTSEVRALHLGTPLPSLTQFSFPEGIRVQPGFAIDDAAGADAFAPFVPPERVDGLARRPGDGAVGIYGHGMSELVLIPLRRNLARDVYEQLAKSKQAQRTDNGIALSVGPLSVLLQQSGRGVFLLTGWVTPQTLLDASADLDEIRYQPRDYTTQARILEQGR